jgi:hypothetical protein
VVLKSKRAAATALLSGESQFSFVFKLQEFYKNSVAGFRSVFRVASTERALSSNKKKAIRILDGF